MLNLTRKFCCSRLPFTNSMPVTDTVGRSNLGVTNEHATRHSDQPMNRNGVRGNMSANDTDYAVHGLDSVRGRDRLRGLAAGCPDARAPPRGLAAERSDTRGSRSASAGQSAGSDGDDGGD